MPVSLADIRNALATIEGGTPGIKAAFRYAPTAPSPLPAFVNFLERGTYTTPRYPGQRDGEHHIRAVALVALQADTSDAERIAEPIIDDFTSRLDQHKTLDNTSGVIEASVEGWEFGPVTLQTSEPSYLGVSFDVRINTIEQVAYASSG